MRGPILNYRLGRMTHEEYEAEASRYWGRNPGDEGESSLAERIRLLFNRSPEGRDRPWCATRWASLSPAGCRVAG
jgi:hypothetical protein